MSTAYITVSCQHNLINRTGCWSAIVDVTIDGNRKCIYAQNLSGKEENTTKERLILIAITESFKNLDTNHEGSNRICVFTDSVYLENLIKERYPLVNCSSKSNVVTQNIQFVRNRGLLENLDKFLRDRYIKLNNTLLYIGKEEEQKKRKKTHDDTCIVE